MSSQQFNDNQNAKNGEQHQGSSSEEELLMNHHHGDETTSNPLEITSNSEGVVQNVFNSSSSSTLSDQPTTPSSSQPLLNNSIITEQSPPNVSSSDPKDPTHIMMPPPPPRTSNNNNNNSIVFPSLLLNHSVSSSSLVPQQTPSHVFYFQSSSNGALFRFIPLFEMIQELVNGEEWRSVKLSSVRPERPSPTPDSTSSSLTITPNSMTSIATNTDHHRTFTHHSSSLSSKMISRNDEDSSLGLNHSLMPQQQPQNSTEELPSSSSSTLLLKRKRVEEDVLLTTTTTLTTTASTIDTSTFTTTTMERTNPTLASSSSTLSMETDKTITNFQSSAMTTTTISTTSSSSVKKTKFSCMNFDDLPIHIRLHILGYIYVPFQECFFSYPILHLNIHRMFGRFKSDPSRRIYLIYSSLGMKLKDQMGQSTPMYRNARDVKLLIDPKVTNLNFLSGFTSLKKLSLYLTDCNFLTLLEKHSKLLPRITFLSLILYKDFSEHHYRETFCKLTNLKTLELFSDLERFSIKGTKFNLPPNLTTLRLLNYEFIDFACICHNTQITSLTVVDSCNLANIDQISNLRNLKRLKINEEQTFDGQNIDLSAIFQLDTLERLSLPLVSFKYRLTGLRSLQNLRIYIEDATLQQIEHYANYILECTTLKKLKFEFAEDLPHNVQNRFIDLISQHPSIESLQLICENITDDQLVNYFFNKNERNLRFPSLTELDISLCDDLSLMPFRYLLERNDLTLDHFKTIKLPAHLVSSGVDECLNVLIPSISFVGGDSALSASYDFDLADFDDDDSTTNDDGGDSDSDSDLLSEILSQTAAASDFLPDSSDDEILEHFMV
ncbi:hypothetical protein FDP41_003491 [Naegleria fowleri]|uniref:Uncharacterized protein n=1 Tax=Naegleria fowleri TaxID=5763 RepID=A0A6A5BX46_NAEFO|nr:uncharacterized protein FDP41_003491 [Naegleria fowleri]KAF0977499.1 hypothetical protein FDP41_003491 [Naegleria fowleri]